MLLFRFLHIHREENPHMECICERVKHYRLGLRNYLNRVKASEEGRAPVNENSSFVLKSLEFESEAI